MMSFVDLDRTFAGQPRELGPVLARIDLGRGREGLFGDQMPELLARLSEGARIASITASNAIEGVVVSEERAERLSEGSGRFRNRNEREFAGYRDAVDELMGTTEFESLGVPFILHLHRLIYAHSGGRGGSLKSDPNLIVSYKGGAREIVFEPTSPEQTEFELSELLVRYEEAKAAGDAHPLLLLAAFVVDFLAIHPVADGNGRLARLLTTHQLLAQGYGVARYVSVEQRIFESRNAYYASLFESQRGWHQGRHDIWPFVGYLTQIIADAYDSFEQKVAVGGRTTGGKQDRVRQYVLEQAPEVFRRRDINRALPGVSEATIRLVLAELRGADRIVAEGKGRAAVWRRLNKVSK